MEKRTEFEDMRPYHDEELAQVYEELIEDSDFRKVMEYVFPSIPFPVFADMMRQCVTKNLFQKNIGYKFLKDIAKKSTDGLKLDHASIADISQPCTYISNHRDIVLDPGFLSALLIDEGLNGVEIAIGDNLLFLPWIKKMVRINKSFIVQRNLGRKQILESAVRLSRYIHYAVKEKKESVWVAQREGRAKDSDDRTQDSLLKMLAMGGEGDMIDSLKSLHILPLTVSYEYDPCDYLKAREFQLKRDIENYKKEFKDDLENMQTGIVGYKGRVEFKTGNYINEKLDQLDRTLSKQELLSAVSAIIDKEIHSNYTIYPGNYVANDLLTGKAQFENNYTQEEKAKFEEYVADQIDKIDLENKDIPFLRERILTMYSNPLVNHLAAIQ